MRRIARRDRRSRRRCLRFSTSRRFHIFDANEEHIASITGSRLRFASSSASRGRRREWVCQYSSNSDHTLLALHSSRHDSAAASHTVSHVTFSVLISSVLTASVSLLSTSTVSFLSLPSPAPRGRRAFPPRQAPSLVQSFHRGVHARVPRPAEKRAVHRRRVFPVGGLPREEEPLTHGLGERVVILSGASGADVAIRPSRELVRTPPRAFRVDGVGSRTPFPRVNISRRTATAPSTASRSVASSISSAASPAHSARRAARAAEMLAARRNKT